MWIPSGLLIAAPSPSPAVDGALAEVVLVLGTTRPWRFGLRRGFDAQRLGLGLLHLVGSADAERADDSVVDNARLPANRLGDGGSHRGHDHGGQCWCRLTHGFRSQLEVLHRA